MTNIESTDFGYKLTFAGSISADEMGTWVNNSKDALSNKNDSFGVMVDMRDLSPLSSLTRSKMEEGQKLYKEKGMVRSAVIVNKGFIATEFKLIAQKTGIYQWERYIDASSNTNWEKLAIDWLVNCADPDIH